MTVIKDKGVRVTLEPAELKLTGHAPTVWITSSFARSWLEDARREAAAGGDIQSRRREIVFAVCFSESYLVEWVRDEILSRDFKKLSMYFPAKDRKGVRQRWRETTRKLVSDGLLVGIPNLEGEAFWRDFNNLVVMRDGLVHANVSRPQSDEIPIDERPLPTTNELQQLEPGRAAEIAVAVVRQFHAAAHTTPPAWI